MLPRGCGTIGVAELVAQRAEQEPALLNPRRVTCLDDQSQRPLGELDRAPALVPVSQVQAKLRGDLMRLVIVGQRAEAGAR